MSALAKEKRIAVWVLRLMAIGCAIYVVILSVSLVLESTRYDLPGQFVQFVQYESDLTRPFLRFSAYGVGLWMFSIYLRIKGW